MIKVYRHFAVMGKTVTRYRSWDRKL